MKKQQTTLNGKGYLPKCGNGIGGWQWKWTWTKRGRLFPSSCLVNFVQVHPFNQFAKSHFATLLSTQHWKKVNSTSSNCQHPFINLQLITQRIFHNNFHIYFLKTLINIFAFQTILPIFKHSKILFIKQDVLPT